MSGMKCLIFFWYKNRILYYHNHNNNSSYLRQWSKNSKTYNTVCTKEKRIEVMPWWQKKVLFVRLFVWGFYSIWFVVFLIIHNQHLSTLFRDFTLLQIHNRATMYKLVYLNFFFHCMWLIIVMIDQSNFQKTMNETHRQTKTIKEWMISDGWHVENNEFC